MKDRINIKLVIGVLLVVFLVLINLNPFHAIDRIISQKYKETVVTMDMLKPNEYMLYHFELQEDGAIKALDSDAWIALFFDYLNIESVKSIDICMEDSSVEDELFRVYTIESYIHTFANVKKGKIRIPITNLTKEDIGIRLDIGISSGNIYNISRIIINDTIGLKQEFIGRLNKILFCLLYVLLLLILLNLGRRKKNKIIQINRYIFERFIEHKQLLIAESFVAGIIFLFMLFKIPNKYFFIIPLIGAFCFGRKVSDIIIYRSRKEQCVLTEFVAFLMFLLLFIVIFSSDNYGIVFYKNSSVENSLYAFLSLYLYVFAINIQAFEDAKTKRFEKNDQLLYNSKFIYVIFIYVLFESSIIGLLNRNSINLFLENLLLFARNDRIFINILLIYFIYLFLANAIGLHISNVIMLLLGNIIFWGNFIKIRFQNSVLTLDDFQLFKEVIGIANAYISSKYIILFLGGIILLLTIGILFRKKLLCYIKLSSSVGIIF